MPMTTYLLGHQIRYPVIVTLVDAVFLLLLSACIQTSDTIYEGRYTSGLEASVFEPCNAVDGGSPENGSDSSQEYWLVTTPESGFNEMLTAYSSHTDQYGQLQVYVRFMGVNSPVKENGYGHLNMYSHQLTLNDVVEMGPWDRDLCE